MKFPIVLTILVNLCCLKEFKVWSYCSQPVLLVRRGHRQACFSPSRHAFAGSSFRRRYAHKSTKQRGLSAHFNFFNWKQNRSTEVNHTQSSNMSVPEKLDQLSENMKSIKETLYELSKAKEHTSTRYRPHTPATLPQQNDGVGLYGPYMRYGMYNFPEDERLLLASAVSGILLGSLVGRVIRLPMLGAIGGVIIALKYYDRNSSGGKLCRLAGKILLIGVYRAAVFVRDFEQNWKAWKVFERAYRNFEVIDEKFNITLTLQGYDKKFGISSKVTSASQNIWKGLETVDETLRMKLLQGLSNQTADAGRAFGQSIASLTKTVERQYQLSLADMSKARDDVSQFNQHWASRFSNFKIEMPSWGAGSLSPVNATS